MHLRFPPIPAAIVALWAFATAACAAPAAPDPGSEPEPIVAAADLVPPTLLSGPAFRVTPEVRMRGYMADFLIDTKFGPLHAQSVELLAVRVAEIPALETLDRASKTGAFARALAERGRKTGAAIVNVITHPVDSVTGLPAGVAHYLRKQFDTWSGRAQSLSDRSSRQLENDGDPYRAPPGPMSAGRDSAADDASPTESKSRAWYARIGSESEREARRYLKYREQRRAMAKQLGIDPNSTNPILNDKLDALAWAAVGGNFSAGVALGQVTGGVATTISYTGKLNQYVLEHEPEQLRELLRMRLLKFCSDDFSVRTFLRRGGFTDTLRTALVDSLEALSPQAGCNELVELAATTRNEVEARYLTDALKLIERHAAASKDGSLVVAGAALAWRTPEGKLLLPLPVDLLTWSHAIGEFLDQPAFAAREKIALIGGHASMTAQRNLTARGWGLVLHAPYEGAPTYAPVFDLSAR